jgi:ribulose-phosphate 3-epimerase
LSYCQKGIAFFNECSYHCRMKTSAPIQIAASILAADFARLGEQATEAEAAGVDALHIDVMDGRFVSNITVGPAVVAALRRVTGLPLVTHLMILEPERFIAHFASSGSNSILVHQETCPHLHRTIQQIKSAGARAGVVLNPATPAACLEDILDDIDSVLVMTVDPGFGGQAFIPGTVRKIARIRQMLDERRSSATLQVDGGISAETAPLVVAAGASVLVAGSSIFGAGTRVDQALAKLRKSIEA